LIHVNSPGGSTLAR